jgi:hypothetical protein
MLRCLEGGAEVIGIVRNRESLDKLQAQLPARARATIWSPIFRDPGLLFAACRKRSSPRTPSPSPSCLPYHQA